MGGESSILLVVSALFNSFAAIVLLRFTWELLVFLKWGKAGFLLDWLIRKGRSQRGFAEGEANWQVKLHRLERIPGIRYVRFVVTFLWMSFLLVLAYQATWLASVNVYRVVIIFAEYLYFEAH